MKKFILKFVNRFPFVVIIRRKPKTQITLMEFYQAVQKVAEERGEKYCNIRIEMVGWIDGETELSLAGYINGTDWFQKCKTVDEVCDKLRMYKKQPEPSPIKEVTF